MYDYLSIRITNLGTIQTNQELVYCNCFYFKRVLIPLSIRYLRLFNLWHHLYMKLKPMVNWIQSVIDSVFILFFVIIRREKYIFHIRKYFKRYMSILHPMEMTYFHLFDWVWDGNILCVNLGKILGLMSAVSKISHQSYLSQTSSAVTCVAIYTSGCISFWIEPE